MILQDECGHQAELFVYAVGFALIVNFVAGLYPPGRPLADPGQGNWKRLKMTKRNFESRTD